MMPSMILSGQATCGDLMQCIYNLSKMDLKIYHILSGKGALRTDDLARMLKKDRSTVYRSLQKMVSCGMVAKETKNIDQGGYYHVYSAVGKDILRERMEECVDELHERMKGALDSIDEL